MTTRKQDFNNTPAGIAIVTTISALLSYRAVRKDPQKVLRIRKRAPFLTGGILAATTAIQIIASRSDDPGLRRKAETGLTIARQAIIGGAFSTTASLITAKFLIGDRTQVSTRRALAWVTLASAYSVANRVYNRSAVPTVEVVEELTEDEKFSRELSEMLATVQRRRQQPNA